MTRIAAPKLSHMAHSAHDKALSFAQSADMEPNLASVNVARQIARELARRVNACKPSQNVSRGLYLRDLAVAHHALALYGAEW
jgi:hypothetical protein